MQKPQKCSRPCYQNNRAAITIQKPSLNKLELILFDMDGVLADIISSWQHIHNHFCTSNEHSVKAYMKGEIDDHEFIRRDVCLWKKQNQYPTYQQVEKILSKIPLMNGASELFFFLHQQNIKTAIVSAGLDILASNIAKKLNINYIYANGLSIDEHKKLTGEGILRVGLMHKDRIVQKLSTQLQIPQQNMASVGNSCFDIPMLANTGLAIAFNPSDDCVKNISDAIVEEKDLTRLIPIFQRYLKNR